MKKFGHLLNDVFLAFFDIKYLRKEYIYFQMESAIYDKKDFISNSSFLYAELSSLKTYTMKWFKCFKKLDRKTFIHFYLCSVKFRCSLRISLNADKILCQFD